mgnify:CR=1 FL=1
MNNNYNYSNQQDLMNYDILMNYAELNDEKAETLVYVSTLDSDIKTKKANKEAAKEVGAAIAKKALDKKIKTVVFDRGGFIYHGVVKELAEAAREAGLDF